jgi:hypothetical protein
MVDARAVSGPFCVAGRIAAGWVRGRRVRVVGRWPPNEKVVRWRRSWPWRDLGSVTWLVASAGGNEGTVKEGKRGNRGETYAQGRIAGRGYCSQRPLL